MTHPDHPIRQVLSWQPHGTWRAIRDVLPDLHITSATADAQLYLSESELEIFGRLKALHEFEIDVKRPLPTALHAWGNQLTACPCGCRHAGLSPSRLMSQGLHACLAKDPRKAWRHLSGHEVACPLLRCTLIPGSTLLSLLQAGWVGAAVLCSLFTMGVDIQKPMDPILVLHAQRRMLLRVAEIQEWRPAANPPGPAGDGVQASQSVGAKCDNDGPATLPRPCWEAAELCNTDARLDTAACPLPLQVP